ncbi:MAG: TonB-dependent receptor [Porphyromonas sp.]|nr:TonB-dependent receptor [Porphyromonas sp.]
MKKILLSTLLLILALSAAKAQSLQGQVRDNTGQPLPYVTLKAISLPDSVVIAGGVSRDDGSFTLEIGDRELPLLLQASLIGYTTQQIEARQLSGHLLTLSESATLLDEVSVVGNRIPHKLVAGGLSTSIEASPLSNLADIYSVLKGVPMVEVEGEEITVTGKGTPIIYINDRLMTDPNQLHNLKPYLIKEIEVITNPGAKYNASTESVIKIYTKREPGSGLSGNLQLNLNRQKGAPLGYMPFAHLNYRKDNWDFFASVWYSQQHNKNQFPKLITHGKTPDSEWINESEVDNEVERNKQNYTLGINYEDEVQSAGIMYRLQGDRQNSYVYTDMISRLQLVNPTPYLSEAVTSRPWVFSHRPNLYYLRKIGQWKAQIDLDYYQSAMSHSTETTKEGHTDAFELRTLVGSHGSKHQSVGTRIDANGPLWGGALTVGGEYSWVNNKFYNYVDDQLTLPDLDTSQKEQLLALYIEYSRSLGNTWSLTGGLRLEHSDNKYFDRGILDPDKSRITTNLFPSFSLGGQLWGINTQLSFRSMIERPDYWQLQPQYQYISRYEYQVGDPNLRPEIALSTSLMANKSWFTMVLSHTYSRDCITQESALLANPDNPSEYMPYVTVLRSINAPPHHGLSATAIASPTIKWWKPTLTLHLEKLIGYDIWRFDQLVTYRKPTLAVSLANQLTLPREFTAAFNVTYVPFGNDDNIEFVSPMLNSWVEVSKRWLKNKNLVTSLSVNNLFNTDITVRLPSKHSVMETTQYTPPRVTFTVTYRFNATKDKFRGTGALESVLDRM